MDDTEYFCNLPGVMMTKHKLSQGTVEVWEDSGLVTLELCNGRTHTMEISGKEDAAVLRYAAHCLEYFAEQKAQANEKAVVGTEKSKIAPAAAPVELEAVTRPPGQARLGLAAAGD